MRGTSHSKGGTRRHVWQSEHAQAALERKQKGFTPSPTCAGFGGRTHKPSAAYENTVSQSLPPLPNLQRAAVARGAVRCQHGVAVIYTLVLGSFRLPHCPQTNMVEKSQSMSCHILAKCHSLM